MIDVGLSRGDSKTGVRGDLDASTGKELLKILNSEDGSDTLINRLIAVLKRRQENINSCSYLNDGNGTSKDMYDPKKTLVSIHL